MKEGRKPEYTEKTLGDKLQKMPHTKALRFKPQARLEPATGKESRRANRYTTRRMILSHPQPNVKYLTYNSLLRTPSAVRAADRSAVRAVDRSAVRAVDRSAVRAVDRPAVRAADRLTVNGDDRRQKVPLVSLNKFPLTKTSPYSKTKNKNKKTQNNKTTTPKHTNPPQKQKQKTKKETN